jgi:DNA-binding PadR family transcriptional regulator
MHLGLAEQAVLAVLAERPAHGFAVAALTAKDGELGRVWHIPRPVVYRALGRLAEAGLVDAGDAESGPGPQRTPYSATPAGRAEARRWLAAPVAHVRDLRSEFLLKLALLDRAGADPAGLVVGQRAALVPIAAALAAERAAGTGFDAVLLAWRESTTAAAIAFLDSIAARGHEPCADSATSCHSRQVANRDS